MTFVVLNVLNQDVPQVFYECVSNYRLLDFLKINEDFILKFPQIHGVCHIWCKAHIKLSETLER